MKPDYRLIVNGTNITPSIRNRLIDLTLTDERGDHADQLDIQLDDSDGDLAIPPRGATIECWIGWLGQLEDKGLFEVDEITHTGNPAVLSITARSADFKGDLKKKREQSYHLVKLGDLLTTLAKRNNLVPAIEQQLADKFIDHLDQTNESDLNLITRLGQRYGALHSIKAGRLLFKLAGRGDTVGGSEIPAVTLKRSQGDNHTFTQTDRETDYTGVQANWNRISDATQQKVIIGDSTRLKVLRDTLPTEAEAKAAAEAEYRKLQRGGSTLNVTLAEGDARLYPETPIIASGYKAEIDAIDWVTKRVVHSLNGNGFTTRVECEVLEE